MQSEALSTWLVCVLVCRPTSLHQRQCLNAAFLPRLSTLRRSRCQTGFTSRSASSEFHCCVVLCYSVHCILLRVTHLSDKALPPKSVCDMLFLHQHCATPYMYILNAHRVIKELLVGEPSTRLEGASAIDVPALLDREYRLNMYSYTQVRLCHV